MTANMPKTKAFLVISVAVNIIIIILTCEENFLNNLFEDPSASTIVPKLSTSLPLSYTSTGTDGDMDTGTSTDNDAKFPLHLSGIQSYVENEVKPTLVYLLTKDSGLGSQLINMFAHKFFFKTYLDQDFIVDESSYGYRKNTTVGILSGYFTPMMPVIDVAHDRSRLLSENVKDFEPTTLHQYINHRNVINEKSPNSLREVVSHSSKLNFVHLLGHNLGVWDLLFSLYPTQDVHLLYYQIAQEMCPSLQFNKKTKMDIKSRMKQHDIPYDRFLGDKNVNASLSGKDDKKMSVGFHIRRGDKIDNPSGKGNESELYPAKDYIDKMIEVVGGLQNAQQNVDICFLATDDSKVINELKNELDAYQMKCQLHTVTSDESHGHDQRVFFREHDNKSAVIEFLTDIALLTQTTYFIGTMGSNVAKLISLLLSCEHPW